MVQGCNWLSEKAPDFSQDVDETLDSLGPLLNAICPLGDPIGPLVDLVLDRRV